MVAIENKLFKQNKTNKIFFILIDNNCISTLSFVVYLAKTVLAHIFLL